MTNERLRSALLGTGLGLERIAMKLGVDPKTVERWIAGRTPYRKHRYAIASMLGLDVAYLWPDALSSQQVTAAGQAEVVAVYPHRVAAPRELWHEMFARAERQIDVLVYSGMWLSEDTRFRQLVQERAPEGLRVRILLGDPESREVALRGEEEGIGDSMPAKVRNALVNYRPVLGLDNVDVHFHATTLYNSIYRVDDEMLVNPHVLGVGAYAAPALHLRRLPEGDMFSTYEASFETVWQSSWPAVEPAKAQVG